MPASEPVERVENLPSPPEGKTGWPWIVDEEQLETGPDEQWPRISVVTPSFNQGHFIEETIRSVCLQRYPNLEYFVIDGGSTDQTLDILEKYDPWLTDWVSEPDRGQSHAINKGFKRSTGEYGTWINSDDLLCPGALRRFALYSELDLETLYIGDCLIIDENRDVKRRHRADIHSFEQFANLPDYWRHMPEDKTQRKHIVQPETVFPLDLYRKVSGLNENNHYTMDVELWGNMLLEGVGIEYTGIDMAMFREHSEQKTKDWWQLTDSLINIINELVDRKSNWSEEKKNRIKNKNREYGKRIWYESGRLARTGLPREFVLGIRSLKKCLLGQYKGKK